MITKALNLHFSIKSEEQLQFIAKFTRPPFRRDSFDKVRQRTILCWNVDCSELREENVLISTSSQLPEHELVREDFSEYVAHLQLHMALQARNLVPALSQSNDSRQELLQQTQADFEKQVSRQSL